jgi:UDP-3-O-[3-hydroxymyristoyl] glucosamine N-acyltransferase
MKKTLRELAEWAGGTVIGDGEVEITGVAPIEAARAGEITFIANPKYLSRLDETEASAVIVSREIDRAAKPLLSVENPYLTFARILQLFHERPYRPGGIDPRASVSPGATLGRDVTLFPFAYVGDRCQIGDRVTLYPGVYVGEGCSVGDDSVLYSNVSLYAGTVVGKRVILHSGVVAGSDGFGFVKEGKRNVKIPQVGTVEIGDDVEIGANTVIDRAALGRTTLQRGVKIDNLVQVAHNVVIGEDSIVVAQVGISGSTRIGKNVTLGGQVGLAGHIGIGDNVMIGAQSGVHQDLPPNVAYTGSPAIPHRDYLRMAMTLPKVPEMRRTLTQMEKRLAKIEEMMMSEKKEK